MTHPCPDSFTVHGVTFRKVRDDGPNAATYTAVPPEPYTPPPLPDEMDLVICGTYGCQNLKQRGHIFCRPCAEDYREDPDAYK